MNVKPSSMRLVAINFAAILAIVLAVLWVDPFGSDAPVSTGKAVKTDAKLAATGKTLSTSNGCTSCHTTDGGSGAGPTWKGLFGSTGKRGKEVDDAYLVETLKTPPAAMASFKGKFSEEEIKAIAEYVKSVS